MTRLVEGVHHAVLDRLEMPLAGVPAVTRGVTRRVYRVIQQTTRLVGKGTEAALRQIEPMLATPAPNGLPTPARRATLAAINGVVGDRLAAHDNPLAIRMNLSHRGRPLDGQAVPSGSAVPGRIVLLIHGLCLSDAGQGAHQGSSQGETLAHELGSVPVSLNYNSGLHISSNGRELAAKLEELLQNWPTPVEELRIIAHSMGGLVARSAHYYSIQQGMNWPGRLKSMVFLGTPHLGAPLEQVGNWVDTLLDSTPFTRPFAALGRVRSAGMTDLRHAYLLDEDWQGKDRFEARRRAGRRLPLPEGVACYAVAGAVSTDHRRSVGRWAGDGLVPLNSALGRHPDPKNDLAFPASAQWVAHGVGHFGLLKNPDVTRQILDWLSNGVSAPA